MKRIFLLIGIIVLIMVPLISLVSAEDFGYNYLEGELNVVQAINYTLISVNDSSFWDGNAWDESRWVFTDGDTMTGNLTINANLTVTEKIYLNGASIFIENGDMIFRI